MAKVNIWYAIRSEKDYLILWFWVWEQGYKVLSPQNHRGWRDILSWPRGSSNRKTKQSWQKILLWGHLWWKALFDRLCLLHDPWGIPVGPPWVLPAACKCSPVPLFLWSRGLCPRDYLGKNTRVGAHPFLHWVLQSWDTKFPTTSLWRSVSWFSFLALQWSASCLSILISIHFHVCHEPHSRYYHL